MKKEKPKLNLPSKEEALRMLRNDLEVMQSQIGNHIFALDREIIKMEIQD